jgi:mRNA capping enzyme, catalytic domain
VDRHQQVPIFLVFDGLWTQINLMLLPFRDRLKHCHDQVRERFRIAQVKAEIDPLFATTQRSQVGAPVIDIFMKNMFEVRDVAKIFSHIIPHLQHENDGLIFTMDKLPYYPGTCQEILKWKPKNLNTIDLKLCPIQNGVCDLFGLYTFRTERYNKIPVLFDLIFLDKESDIKVKELLRSCTARGKSLVLECNYDPEYRHPQ